MKRKIFKDDMIEIPDDQVLFQAALPDMIPKDKLEAILKEHLENAVKLGWTDGNLGADDTDELLPKIIKRAKGEILSLIEASNKEARIEELERLHLDDSNIPNPFDSKREPQSYGYMEGYNFWLKSFEDRLEQLKAKE